MDPNRVKAAPLERISAIWQSRVNGPARAALYMVLLAAVLIFAHLARLGTPVARALTATILLALVVAAIARWSRQRRGW